MTPPQILFHALLRPSVLQILRATGYHSTKTAVLDSLTDLAARYLSLLCENTSAHAVDNGTELDPTIIDVRMALQDVGALLPERVWEEQQFMGEEDMRGVEEFIAWFMGPRFKEIKNSAAIDGDPESTDYLNGEPKCQFWQSRGILC
jgi:transcription initiation factor TFIID subunit 3